MLQARLTRIESSDEGTFGIFSGEGIPTVYTAEPPWRDNRPNLSCIPAGEYEARPWESARFPGTWRLEAVPERSAILTHQGNLAGDFEKGYVRHSLGCILVGDRRGWIRGQKAVLLSVVAMRRLREAIGRRAFRIRIAETYI